VTDRIRVGDLGAELQIAPESPLSDETDDLARGLQGMLIQLRELVGQVQQTANSVTGSANALDESIQRVRVGNEGISSTVSDVALGMEHQRELLDHASERSREVASEIERNAGHARKAGTGAEVASLAIEKMRTVFERVEKTASRVFDLEEKTRTVHQISEIITSVAHRTNLLSLNASIEAARAGEAGRGFSVVADEIRKLSENAGQSAEEISKLIHEIQSETSQVADEVRESSLVIGEGREDVNTIAASLGQITMAVSEAAARSEEIFHGADGHTRSVERIVSSVDEIAKGATAHAASIEQVAGTARAQLDVVAAMVEGSAELAELARKLQRALETFRTGCEGGASEAAP
jgi:methyl-accepting chemotaxis protein